MINETNYIKELKNKNIEALEYIADKYSNLLFKVAYSILNNREYSKEVVNDSLMKIWNNGDSFTSEDERFKNWMCTITKYTAIDRLRKESKHEECVEIKESLKDKTLLVEDNTLLNEELETIRTAIDSMKSVDKEIFIRRFYGGETVKEISKILKITENAVSLRILRGRKKISESLEEGK